MALDWKQMGCMEPDWYAPDLNAGSPALLMNWDETTWLLCTQTDNGYSVLADTETDDPDEAKIRADKWLADNHQ